MKRTYLLLAVFILLSFSLLFAQTQPILISPSNGQPDVNPDAIDLIFELPAGAYNVDSFFDVFCDIDPEFSGAPYFSEPLEPIGGQFTVHIDAARPYTPFYWFVRYHNLAMGYVTESAVYSFVTGQTVIPCTKIKGNLSSYGGTFGVAGCWFYCPGALYPASYKTNSSGYYDFWVANGNTYTITHACPYVFYYISPASAQIPVPSNQTQDIVQNFYMVCWKPNQSNIVYPNFAEPNVAITLPSLQWSHFQDPDYTSPEAFTVYLSATGAGMPLIVDDVIYIGDGNYEYPVFPMIPLEYGTEYEWKITPYNFEGGDAEGVETWTFETEPYPDPYFPPTLYVYPQDNDFGVEDIGLVMYWGDPEDEKDDFPVDSFFDVYMDTDPDFTGLSPIYSGPGLIDPYNPNGYYCYAPPLNLNTTYYWYIKLTLPSEEVHNSPTWSFLTTSESIFNPQPVAVVPGDQANDIEARMTEFMWDLPDFPVDSFFDVFCDIDPDFPDPPIYSGPGTLLDPFPDRWIYIHPLLLPNETYYWFVRYTNISEHYYTGSGTVTFMTGGYIPPEPPILWSPVLAELDVPLDVPLKCRKPVDLPPPDSFFDVFCDIDLAFPNPAVYSGPGIPDQMDPELYIFPLEDLLENQTYHWFIRLTDVATGLSSDSEIRFFTTGNFIQPGIPEFLIPPPDVVIPGVIVHLDAGATYNIGYDVKGLQNYWDFGDAPAPPPNFDNIAVQQGYVAKCTVTDVDGDEATGSISVEVDSDSDPTNWYVLSHYSGLWHPGDPYPSFGYGPRLIYLNPPPGGKGEFYIMFVEGDGLDPTLPVELSSFDAVVTSEMFVSLSWVVQSETNLLGYYILRNDTELLNSALTLNPGPITEGSALGTQVTYQYTDAQVEQGNTYYYWLNSMDLDGTTHFYGPVSVTVTGGDPDDPVPIIPLRTELRSAYPNPFNPNTTIPFNLKAAGDVKIEVFNNKGQLIWRYEEKGKAAGYHSVVWDGTDLSGRAVSSGVYHYRMTCGKYSAGKKAVLLK